MTETTTGTRLRHVRATERESLWFLGDHLQPLIRGGDTDGGLFVAHYTAAPASQPPLHEHDDDDELFFLLAGEIEYWAEGEEPFTAGAGDTVLLPRGVPHTFRASPTQGATWILILSPSSKFEDLVDAVAKPAEGDGPEPGWQMDDETLGKLGAAVGGAGVRLLGPPGTLPAGAAQAEGTV